MRRGESERLSLERVSAERRRAKAANTCPSELEFERELDGAWAADLVQGIKAGVGAAGAQAVCQCLSRLRSVEVIVHCFDNLHGTHFIDLAHAFGREPKAPQNRSR
jgi:hypothetical protein